MPEKPQLCRTFFARYILYSILQDILSQILKLSNQTLCYKNKCIRIYIYHMMSCLRAI